MKVVATYSIRGRSREDGRLHRCIRECSRGRPTTERTVMVSGGQVLPVAGLRTDRRRATDHGSRPMSSSIRGATRSARRRCSDR
jgi:hypothetical protein